MWKLLRIGAVVALLVLGALKLGQSLASRTQMASIAGALAPSLRLSYQSVSGALDGEVVLEKPRLEVTRGPARGSVISAARAIIEPDDTLWLIKRMFAGGAAAPPSLAIHLDGTSLTQPVLDRLSAQGWFGATSMVPFESLGCGSATHFTAREYARIGAPAQSHRQDIRYAYDAEAHTLHLDLVATSAPFATITTHVELSQFAPSAWLGDDKALAAERVEQFSLTYADGGYLAKRNRYCAQLTGVDAANFAGRHVAAVIAFLAERGVTPGSEVESLYRKLVTSGGSAELSSLPDATFVPAEFSSYAATDLLRALNVTLRRDTAPPILLRLNFASPDAIAAAASDTAPAATAAPDGEASSTPEPAETATPETVIVATPPAAPAVPDASVVDDVPLLSAAHAASIPLQTPPPAAPAPSEIADVATPEPQPQPTEDQAAASEPSATMPRPAVDPRDATLAIPASAPPPPPGTTAALVWRAPTIERLPEEQPREESAFVAVPADSLGSYRGAFVRLTTLGGKRIEGRVVGLDGTDIVLRVRRSGGSAVLRIPRKGIRQAELHRTVSE